MNNQRVKLGKKEASKYIAEKIGKSISEANEFLDALIEFFNDELPANDIGLKGIGVWKVKHSKARSGYDPANKKYIDIPDKNRVNFKASKKLGKAVI